MTMKIVRTLITGAALSIPFASIACNKPNENPEVAKPIEIRPIDLNLKKAIDEKRIVLEKKEREFAQELGGWASSDLPNLLLNLYMVLDSKDEIVKGNTIAFKLIKRSEDFIDLTGNDYSKKPNEEQLEEFNRLISVAEKGAPLVLPYVEKITLEEISKKVEGYLQKNAPELKGEKLKETLKHELEYFEVYKETFKGLVKQRTDLFTSMKSFNEEVKKANEPAYNPVWGLGLERLQNITIFVSKK